MRTHANRKPEDTKARPSINAKSGRDDDTPSSRGISGNDRERSLQRRVTCGRGILRNVLTKRCPSSPPRAQNFCKSLRYLLYCAAQHSAIAIHTRLLRPQTHPCRCLHETQCKLQARRPSSSAAEGAQTLNGGYPPVREITLPRVDVNLSDFAARDLSPSMTYSKAVKWTAAKSSLRSDMSSHATDASDSRIRKSSDGCGSTVGLS